MAKTPQNSYTLKTFLLSFLKFLKADFSIKKHVPVYLFTAVMIFLLYAYDFDNWKKNLDITVGQNMLLLFTCYALSFFIPLFWVLYVAKPKTDYRGIGVSLFFIGLFAFTSAWSPYHHFSFFRESEYYYWYRKVLANLTPFLFFLLAFLAVWKPFFKGTGRFMWNNTDVHWLRIIFPLLLAVVIIVVTGSQMGDFGSDYPSFKYRRAAGDGIMPALQVLSFEAAYALDFYVIELLFRGVLVLGLIRYFGTHILLPVATFYVFVHYGKPMAETISSFFGAYILGYLAIYTRSVLPGTILHVTLAWSMEAVAVVILGNI